MSHPENISHNFIGINDSTLREGEQYNGSVFSLADQSQILEWLYLIGVDTVEVGNPIVPEIQKDLQFLSRITRRPPLMAHIRNTQSDLNAALETGINGVHIMCAADPGRLATLHQTLPEHISAMVQNVKHAQAEHLVVRVSVEHGLEERFFPDALQILKTADSLHVDRVQVADTKGVLFPWDVTHIIQNLRQEVQTEIGVHFHHDLTHSVGNALFALSAGANWVDTTLLGLGERTGITPTSAFLLNLYMINPQLVANYSLHTLTEIEQAMAEMVHMPVPHNLPTSDTAFSHKAGIHTNGIKRQGTETYEPFDPEVVGNQRIIVTDSRISGRKVK